jgi:capsular exopolysaccharide synthesis family protein
MLSQTVKDPQDVTRRLGLPILGLIPRVDVPDIRQEVQIRSSELSEAYKSTRTNLTFLTSQGAPRVLMLTSSVPSEGKSLSCLALATSFAQLGKRTLLIDADLRNSRMQVLLGGNFDKKGGLAALLSGNAPDLADQVVNIDDFGIDYLPHGYTPPNPVELLASDRFRELLDEAKTAYDQIIVDSAPMLNLADAIELSRAVDGVVYVIESNRIKLRAIENSIERLTRTGAQVYGAIVTKLSANSAGYGYGYGSGAELDKPAS